MKDVGDYTPLLSLSLSLSLLKYVVNTERKTFVFCINVTGFPKNMPPEHGRMFWSLETGALQTGTGAFKIWLIQSSVDLWVQFLKGDDSSTRSHPMMHKRRAWTCNQRSCLERPGCDWPGKVISIQPLALDNLQTVVTNEPSWNNTREKECLRGQKKQSITRWYNQWTKYPALTNTPPVTK